MSRRYGEYEERPGIFAPGFASGKARLVEFVGIVVAVVGGLHGKDKVALEAGIGIILAGGLMDLFARRGSSKVINVIAAALVLGVILMWRNPHLMYVWMSDLAAHSNSYLGGH